VALSNVQGLVDLLGDGSDVGAQLPLSLVHGLAVLLGYKVNGDSQVPKAPGATNTMQVGLRHLRKVKVDDHVHVLAVDTASEEIRRHEATGVALSEVVEDPITVSLCHLGVDVETRVAKLRDLLGQEFNPLCRIAEDDGLLDLEFGEQGVEAVHLLGLLHKGVVLGHSLQSQFIHQIDFCRISQATNFEVGHANWESSGE